MGVQTPNLKVLFNVSLIVFGVVLASFGEIQFVLVGFLFQVGGIVFEAIRLVMVQRLLNGSEYKMDPLVSLYYFAPVCALMNGIVALVWEVPKVSMAEIQYVGFGVLLANAVMAFCLNVSVVFLVSNDQTFLDCTNSKQIGKTSSLVLTLCGVLKDIILVAASMLIWGTTVTGLQFFGYAIALGGLVYYKLGGDELKGTLTAASRNWWDFGAKRPLLRKTCVVGGIFTVVIILLGGLAPSVGAEIDTVAWIGSMNNWASEHWSTSTKKSP